jgi:hypothetical protein
MNTRREQALTLATLAGLTAAFIAAVALPGRNARAALNNDIAAAKLEIGRGPAVLDGFRIARTDVQRCRKYLESSSALVAEPHDLLQAISRIAQTSGLSVVRIEPDAALQRSSYSEHPFKLEFTAKLGALTDFLAGLERSERLYVIEELVVRSQAAQQSGEVLEGTIRFVVYAPSRTSATLGEENDSRGPR